MRLLGLAGVSMPRLRDTQRYIPRRVTPDFNYYMTINAIFISIVLLIPALGAFVLRRPAGNGPVWLLFWTAEFCARRHFLSRDGQFRTIVNGTCAD